MGKSSIIVQQVSDLFLEDHGFTFEPTLEDIYKKQIIVGEEIFALEIVDTSGREDIRSDLNLDEKYLEEGEGFMLVFDINDPKTFISVLLYRERIIRLNSNKRVRYQNTVWNTYKNRHQSGCITSYKYNM